MKVIFCGTPDFSVVPLQHLIAAGIKPIAVFTQPDRPKGRGQKLQKSAVKLIAEQHRIEVFQPLNFKNPQLEPLISSLQPDLMVVVAYGLLLPQNILSLPKFGCWNIHASLLPRWRGAAPIQRAILAGDEQSGVSIMQMEAGLDTGPVYRRYACPITNSDTAQSLHDKLAKLGGKAIVNCIQALQNNDLETAVEQDHQQANYAKKLNKTEAQIDWQQTAQQIERQIRAFNPWPGSSCELLGEPLKIWRAEVLDQTTDQKPGSVVKADKKQLLIQCKEQCLNLLEVQKAGKKRMPIAAFMAGKQNEYRQ